MTKCDNEHHQPVLPQARGEISNFVIGMLRSDPSRSSAMNSQGFPSRQIDINPLTSDDLHLALYTCYELHYMSFSGVDPDWEWNTDLMRITVGMESEFLQGLLHALPDRSSIDEIIEGQLHQQRGGVSASSYLQEQASIAQFREFLIHRSAYHLKEADPHTWVIPRLYGRPKAALCALQLDEYGSGRVANVHSRLFAKTMRSLNLNPAYGAYLNAIPGFTLATVNILSLFGLHRKWRGALMGSLTVAEIKSSPSSARLAKGLRRLGFGEDAEHFFSEHVEADAVHEQLMRQEVISNLLKLEPELAPSIAFGAQSSLFLSQISTNLMLDCWHHDRSSLYQP
jgi:Iron-containing redox enzyme